MRSRSPTVCRTICRSMPEVANVTFVGRERELDAIGRFLEQVPAGPSALLIEGEAGIGKTAVWLEALRLADETGLRVLRARPAEAEARLSYVALAALVGTAFDETRALLLLSKNVRSDRRSCAMNRVRMAWRVENDGHRARQRPHRSRRAGARARRDRRSPVARPGHRGGPRVRVPPAAAPRRSAARPPCRTRRRASCSGSPTRCLTTASST